MKYLLLLVFLIFPAGHLLANSLTRGETIAPQNDLRQLIIAIQVYGLDHQQSQADENSPAYPDSLKDLVRGNYISQEDLDKLTKSQVFYFKPDNDPTDPNLPILISHSEFGIFAAFADTTTQYFRAPLPARHDPFSVLILIVAPFAVIICAIVYFTRRRA